MINNCFHHIPSPEAFFEELTRVLEPGGGCVLIDPYHGLLASKFYKEFCTTECFDKKQKKWSDFKKTAMQGANQALTYIVFKRDRQIFDRMYPNLEVVYIKPLDNYMRYIL